MTLQAVSGELSRLDTAVYAAIARTRTPALDQALGRLSARGGVHYPSDVVAGAVIGLALSSIAVAVTERYRGSAP